MFYVIAITYFALIAASLVEAARGMKYTGCLLAALSLTPLTFVSVGSGLGHDVAVFALAAVASSLLTFFVNRAISPFPCILLCSLLAAGWTMVGADELAPWLIVALVAVVTCSLVRVLLARRLRLEGDCRARL